MVAIILFLHLFFGLWFVYQTYISRSQKIFSEFIINSCIFAYLLLLFFAANLGVLPLIFSIYLPIFAFVTAEYFFIYKRWRNFRNQFIVLLDSTIARMKMGQSFRTALNHSIESIESRWIKDELKELRDRMIYSQQIKSKQAKELLFAFQAFQQADQDSQPMTRLHYIQQAMKVENLFRRKAHQALLQIRLQSLIMTILYLGFLIFILWYYGTQFLTLILFSTFLFLSGAVLIFILGRKIKWTL